MKTNWQALSKKLGVLKEDGSELYQGVNSSEALEEILGDEWLQDAVDTFIEGTPGNELAIKTLRFISSTRAAEMAYKIYTDNKDIDQQKASLAVWALSDIRTEKSMDYVEEIIERPEYEVIAVGVLRNLIFDHIHLFEEQRLYNVLNKVSEKYIEDIEPLKEFVKQHYQPSNWYELLSKIQKRPTMYGIQKVEDIFMLYVGYSIALQNKSILDNDLMDFETRFTNFVIKDYNAPSHCNWCTAIRLYSSSDSESVAIFFEELAKYRSGKSEFDRIQYREDNKIFCCEKMAESIHSIDGIVQYDNTDVLINKYGTGTYSLKTKGKSTIEINNCLWCGTKLKMNN
jgi:hypothetical protein